MDLSIRTLIAIYCIAVTLTLGFLAYISYKEFQKPLPHEIPSGSSGEPLKNKIQKPDPVFQKIGQSSEITFILSESRTISHKEMQCLAKNIYHEARGEGLIGMVGVAQITINRADKQYRGKSNICNVVHDSNQFSWTAGKNKKHSKLNNSSWQDSLYVARLVSLGIRIKGLEDSIYFHSNKIKSPNWSKHFPVNKRIGNHIYLGSI